MPFRLRRLRPPVRNQVSEAARVVVHSEALGEMAAACAEIQAKYATSQARQALPDRMQAIRRPVSIRRMLAMHRLLVRAVEPE